MFIQPCVRYSFGLTLDRLKQQYQLMNGYIINNIHVLHYSVLVIKTIIKCLTNKTSSLTALPKLYPGKENSIVV